MNINTWNRRALSLCLMAAMFAAYSLNALAATPKMAGELIVSGKSIGEQTSVMVNGSNVESGSTIFSSSSIVTPENADATVNVGKIGRVQIAPGTNISLSFDSNSFTGNLVAGKTVVLSASDVEGIDTVFSIANVGSIKLAPNTSVTLSAVNGTLVADLMAGTVTALNTTGKMVVVTPNGKSVNLSTGESASTNAGDYRDSAGNCVDSDNDGNLDCGAAGSNWLWWGLVFGGAIAGIILAANSSNNRVDLGGGGTVVSPTS
ncbi:MAG: hypothetical protein ACK5NT_02475 [Pyrinomonadaceae bacterium]